MTLPRQTHDLLLFLPIPNEGHNDSLATLLSTSLSWTLASHPQFSNLRDRLSFTSLDARDALPTYSDWRAADFAQHLVAGSCSSSSLAPDLGSRVSEALAVRLNFVRQGLV